MTIIPKKIQNTKFKTKMLPVQKKIDKNSSQITSQKHGKNPKQNPKRQTKKQNRHKRQKPVLSLSKNNINHI